MKDKPLFIPLKAVYYAAFKSGDKREELRLYGPRWNENTCRIGREVVLSKGYGKKHRMSGVIWKFKKQRGDLFALSDRIAIKILYGSLNIDIACISIKDIREIKNAGD